MKIRLIVVCALSALAIAACSNNARVGSCQGACSVGMICDTATSECVSTTPTFPGTGLPCDVAAVLQNHCLTCHGAQPAGGAPNSLVTRTQLLSASPAGGTYAVRAALRMRDLQSPMPPSSTGDVITAEERATFENWVTANYPSGACTDATATPSGGGDGATGGGDGATGGGTSTQGGGVATQGGGTAVSGGGSGAMGGGTGATGGGSSAAGGGAGVTGDGTGANTDYCAPCTSDADCGGTGNFCIGFTFGDYCGTDCTSTTCAADERCANIVDSSNTVLGKNCVPVTGATCTSAAGGGTGATGGGTGTTGGGTGATGGGTGTTGGGSGTTGGGTGTACTTDTWSSWAQSFFNNRCSSCHGNEFTHSCVTTYESSIYSRINSGNMPQGTTLSSTEKQRILKYLSCGAP